MKIKPPFLRAGNNYDTNEAGDETALHCMDATLTQQSFAEEVDINTIVKRFGITGQLPTNVLMPTYGNFEQVMNYHDAMNAIRAADEAFYSMPAEIRAKFNNNAGMFVDFCSDEANRDEAVKLGLVLPKAAELAKTPPGSPAEPPPAKEGKKTEP